MRHAYPVCFRTEQTRWCRPGLQIEFEFLFPNALERVYCQPLTSKIPNLTSWTEATAAAGEN